MTLSPSQAERFYRIWWPLLGYCNRQKHIVTDFPGSLKAGSIDPQAAKAIRDVLWESPELLVGFVESNPARLPEEDLELASRWRHRVEDRFYVMRHLKKYSVFLQEGETPKAYGVLGIISTLEEVLPYPPPVLVEAVLLPFENKIIYDSLVLPYSVSFGPGIRKRLNTTLRKAQELGGILTSLDPVDETETNIEAIIRGNQKILAAFRKDLMKAGLSEKTQEEHRRNVESFVDDYLLQSDPPRSLITLEVDDLDRYFRRQSGKVNRISFKRLVRFLLNSDRIDWDAAQSLEQFLKKA